MRLLPGCFPASWLLEQTRRERLWPLASGGKQEKKRCELNSVVQKGKILGFTSCAIIV